MKKRTVWIKRTMEEAKEKGNLFRQSWRGRGKQYQTACLRPKFPLV